MIGRWLAPGFVVVLLGVVAWASDKISYEGERTIYTVQCRDGAWEERRCIGKLAVGERYRFRASKSRQEVLYWIAGSSAASAKYTDCMVKDRGNWTCKSATDQLPTIIYAMVDGRPIGDGAGRTLPFHAMHKWKWWLLRAGVPIFREADD